MGRFCLMQCSVRCAGNLPCPPCQYRWCVPLLLRLPPQDNGPSAQVRLQPRAGRAGPHLRGRQGPRQVRPHQVPLHQVPLHQVPHQAVLQEPPGGGPLRPALGLSKPRTAMALRGTHLYRSVKWPTVHKKRVFTDSAMSVGFSVIKVLICQWWPKCQIFLTFFRDSRSKRTSRLHDRFKSYNMRHKIFLFYKKC